MVTRSRIAVIGVGKMGGAVARNLARTERYQVVVHDVSAEAIDACTRVGAVAARSVQEAASDCDLVITSLPLPEHVLAVWSEVASLLAPAAIGMDVSTIDPHTAVTIRDELAKAGNPFVTCALGKGPAQAETADIPLFVGGSPDVVHQLQPVFDAIGSGTHHLGSVEAASAFKLVSNMIGMANLAVLAEGFSVCLRAGVTAESFALALAETGGASYQSENRLPWMIADDFKPRFSVRLGLKDTRLAVDMAARWAIATPLGAAGMAQLASAQSHGYGQEDVTAILKVIAPDHTRASEQSEATSRSEDQLPIQRIPPDSLNPAENLGSGS